MSLTAAMIDAMVASGCSAEQMAAVMKAALADREEKAAEKRAKDAERQRKSRANRGMSRDVTVTECDECDAPPFPAPSPSFPPDPLTNPTPTHTPGNTPRTRKAIPISDDWQPAQFGPRTQSRAIVDGWPPGEMDTQLEHFRAHHRAKGNVFKDWQDAWSTWVLGSRRFGGSQNGAGQQNRTASEPRNPLVRAVARRKAERAAGEFPGFPGCAGGGPEGGDGTPAISGQWE